MNRKRLLIILFPSFLILTLLIVGIVISIPKPYIRTDLATDDITLEGHNIKPDNSNILQIGVFRSQAKRCLIRFDLTNKPKNWSRCEISIYISKSIEEGDVPIPIRFRFYLNCNGWDENDDDISGWEVYDWYVDLDDGLGLKTGFMIFNITDYIRDYDSITLYLGTGIPNYFSPLDYWYYNIISRNSNLEMKYKPLLLWR